MLGHFEFSLKKTKSNRTLGHFEISKKKLSLAVS